MLSAASRALSPLAHPARYIPNLGMVFLDGFFVSLLHRRNAESNALDLLIIRVGTYTTYIVTLTIVLLPFVHSITSRHNKKIRKL